MAITLSVATSVDGYIDDCSTERLTLSSKEDWERIYALRADSDAILIGAGTLRSDNPTLTLKSDELKAQRIERGVSSEPARIIISGSGDISPELRIFHKGEGQIIIFSNIERKELSTLAEVIVMEEITASNIVSKLERKGLYSLFVEGGAKIHKLFLKERMVDKLRVACNPSIRVNDSLAPRFDLPKWIEEYHPLREEVGGVVVNTYQIDGAITEIDNHYMELSIKVSHSSLKSKGCYCVGAVIVTPSGEVFTGYTGEVDDIFHAEQAAIYKAKEAGVDIQGATIYSSMEPCSQRSRAPKSCSQLIIEHGFSRVCFAIYEPSCFVECKGAARLRTAGIRVDVMSNYIEAVEAVNAHLLKKYEKE